MKVIIAGSRDLDPLFDEISAAEEASGFKITEVVSGTARGVDQAGEGWAEVWGVPIKRFPADWNKHGKSAGYIRNRQMGYYADALIAFWDGKSHGTKNMIDLAEAYGLKVYVVNVV